MFGKFISYYIWIESWRFLITCLSTRKNAHSSIDPRDYWKIPINSTLESFARTALEHSIDLTKVLRLQILSTMAMYCILWKNARALCQFHLPVLHSKKNMGIKKWNLHLVGQKFRKLVYLPKNTRRRPLVGRGDLLKNVSYTWRKRSYEFFYQKIKDNPLGVEIDCMT